jgi:hypothetical protein
MEVLTQPTKTPAFNFRALGIWKKLTTAQIFLEYLDLQIHSLTGLTETIASGLCIFGDSPKYTSIAHCTMFARTAVTKYCKLQGSNRNLWAEDVF